MYCGGLGRLYLYLYLFVFICYVFVLVSVNKDLYIAVRKVASPLRELTCHIWDHTVLAYLPPDRADSPVLTSVEAGTRFNDPGGITTLRINSIPKKCLAFFVRCFVN